MATTQQMAPIPPITLVAGMTLTFEAINPTTGANVAGVTVSEVSAWAGNPPPDDVAPLSGPDGIDWLNLPVEGS